VRVYDASGVEKTNATGGGGVSSPLTTKGDLWGYGTADARVPIGTNGQVLTVDTTAAQDLKYVDQSALDTTSTSAIAAAEAFATAADATQLALLIKKDGSVAFTGDQSMGSHKLTNLATPTAASSDAATTNYVDTTTVPIATFFGLLEASRLCMNMV